jgi:phosphoribosylaminoimidazolecarboxamide formyltransferase / IMP cyclohydrolase
MFSPSSSQSTPQQRQPMAFLSVYDKTNLVPFAQQLVTRFNYQLVATGGTRQHLEAAGLSVEDLSAVTGFDQLLGGRVKSLHPEVFAGLLAAFDDPAQTEGLRWQFDLLVVNLYPFEQAFEAQSPELTETGTPEQKNLTELIDIGGSALIRAAAKNHAHVTVVANPLHYEPVLIELIANQGQTRPEFRRILAREAFTQSATYDSAIAAWMAGGVSTVQNQLAPTLNITLHQLQPMRYGENPHQPAALYRVGRGDLPFEVLQGKALSYNNLLDMEAAWALLCEFDEQPTAAIIKHTQPCGVAMAPTILKAYQQAFDADPMSAFGGIVALNRPVDETLAKLLASVFLEVIVAPEFSPKALEILATKKNVRLVQRAWPSSEAAHPALSHDGLIIRQVSPELFLAQINDYRSAELMLNENLKVVTDKKPTEAQLLDLAFAWRVAKHVKSNAIVVAKDGKTVGLCGGQTSRVGALERAIGHACDEASDGCLASDGFFPAVDNIEIAAQNRIGAIIQPGGSIKDLDVIAACNRYGIAMVTTGVREFRH